MAPEAEQQRAAERPGLALVVFQIGHFQAGLLFHFPVHGLFDRLADLGIAGDQRVMGVDAVRVLGQQEFSLLVQDADDGGRGNARVHDTAALRTAHRALFPVRLHAGAAAAAEGAVPHPGEQLPAGHSRKGQLLGLVGAHLLNVDQNPVLRGQVAEVESCIVNLKQIGAGGLRTQLPAAEEGLVRVREHPAVLIPENPVLRTRRAGMIFIVVAAGKNILDHRRLLTKIARNHVRAPTLLI